MLDACATAACLVEARARIRTDCRPGSDGVPRLRDLDVKPNLAGTGRLGRDDQGGLSAIAARVAGWS